MIVGGCRFREAGKGQRAGGGLLELVGLRVRD